MSEPETDLFSGTPGNSWIRLRTLIVLRWIAIGGQVTAIIVALWFFNLKLQLDLCYLAIGISVIGNLVPTFIYPENKRMSEAEIFGMVLFDLLQLAFLLYLTGGLHNPFAILLLGPVTVSANAMKLRSNLVLGTLTIVLATILAQFHLPLRTEEGFVLRIPDVFVYGNWVAVIIAVFFMSLYSRRVRAEVIAMARALSATQMALSREQKLTDLGGVVAAAAHELGTPLATIKLTSSELIDELEDRQELREDAQLIREQADRCRDILRDMGRAGKDDLHLRKAPLTAVLQEAADPHLNRGIEIDIRTIGTGDQPCILRKPEIIHGLRNLIQNAVDFARSRVWIEADWNADKIIVRILDDGRGYPLSVLGRIGEPFVRRRQGDSQKTKRPGYEGMGLGLFIAKTLLERSGAELSFANGTDPYLRDGDIREECGAIVDLVWPRQTIDADSEANLIPSGANQPIRQ